MFKLIRSLISLIVGCAIAIVLLNTVFLPNDYKSCSLECLQASAECEAKNSTSCQKSDVIIVLSGGDTMARAKYGITLYNLGIAKKLLFVGAAADGSESNASAMSALAMRSGVPIEDILVEEQSRNTCENAKLSKKVLENNKFRKITLVTSAYHQRRATGEFERVLGTDYEIYDAPLTQDADWSKAWYTSPKAWYFAVKEALGLLRQLSGWSC